MFRVDGLGPQVRPVALRPGDRVALVSPASTPTADGVTGTVRYLESLGLVAEVGTHALDELNYLAGTDENRLADLNHAIRDPGIRAIVATRGGKGAYRIVDGLDFAALAADPGLLPPDWQAACGKPKDAATAGVVRDYIAGMTDRFALEEHSRIFHTQIVL